MATFPGSAALAPASDRAAVRAQATCPRHRMAEPSRNGPFLGLRVETGSAHPEPVPKPGGSPGVVDRGFWNDRAIVQWLSEPVGPG